MIPLSCQIKGGVSNLSETTTASSLILSILIFADLQSLDGIQSELPIVPLNKLQINEEIMQATSLTPVEAP